MCRQFLTIALLFICFPDNLNMWQDELGKANKQDGIVAPVGIFSGIDVMAGVAGWLDYFRP